MTSDEFKALLRRDRRRAILEWAEAWLDANGESRRDTIESLTSLATCEGTPRIDLGDDEDLAAAYDELVGNDYDEDEAVADFGLGLVDEEAGGIVAYFDDEDLALRVADWLNREGGDDEPDADSRWWVTDLGEAEARTRDESAAAGTPTTVRDGEAVACLLLPGADETAIRRALADPAGGRR